MKFTKKHFEPAAATVRALPMTQRKGKALLYVAEFRKSNSKFDHERFFAACMVSVPAQETDAALAAKDVEIDLRSVEFTIFYRWNDCDVDAALVPHLSLCCGTVEHEVGKADLLGGGYKTGPVHKTPVADDVIAIAHHWADRTQWPKGVKPCGGYAFVQGYSDAIFEYEGNLELLPQVVAECKSILARLIKKHVRYHVKGDKIKNKRVNTYAGTGSGIHRTS